MWVCLFLGGINQLLYLPVASYKATVGCLLHTKVYVERLSTVNVSFSCEKFLIMVMMIWLQIANVPLYRQDRKLCHILQTPHSSSRALPPCVLKEWNSCASQFLPLFRVVSIDLLILDDEVEEADAVLWNDLQLYCYHLALLLIRLACALFRPS